MTTFSAKNRNAIIEQLITTTFDVLVIGGGITGAGIALDASARGLKVALVDMQDFAGGTSSKSTKLIHGGLRYLKQLELKLVAEVGKERKIVHHNAPHLTKPEPMLLPIIKNGSLGKFSARIGMWVYEWLAGVKKEEWHKVLTIEQTLAHEPLLNKNNLLGGILFYEYRTDDARLTIEVLKAASNKGVMALNYSKVVEFIYTNAKISGVIIEDQFTKEIYTIKAKYIVNAGGPWVDAIDDLDNNSAPHKLHITKGVHLVFNHKKLAVTQSVYFDTPDKRMIFVIPRDGKTYVGTTDTFYNDNINQPTISNEDRDYLLKCVNNFFPAINLTLNDIESGWAGLRPLINKPGKGPSEISRKDEVFSYSSGLLTISGGKLTGYRKMAQRITNIIAKKMQYDFGEKIGCCTTDTIFLSGGNMKNTFNQFLEIKIKEGAVIGLSANDVDSLVNRYGTNIDQIFTIIKNISEKENSNIPLILRAQVIYCIENEMCTSPSDFFVRRTGALYFNIELVKKWQLELSNYMQNLLHWNTELKTKLNLELESTIKELEKIKS